MRVLVVAATVIELEWVERAETLAVGVGPVEAAAGTARRLAADRPDAVLHVGIAGAHPGSGLAVGDAVIGTESRYVDLRAQLPTLIGSCAPDPDLLARLAAALPDARQLAIATSAAVGAGAECPVEAMEGFAVLRAAARAGVPAIELRVVSNMADEPDRSKWDFAGGLAALAAVGRRALDAL